MIEQLILKVIGGEQEDWHYSKHLLLMGMYMGIFLATYTTVVSAMFIDTFDERKLLPYAIVCQGAVGVFITWGFNRIGRIQGFKASAQLILGAFIMIILVLALDLTYVKLTEWSIFMAYVIMIPCNALLVIIFWDTFNRIFPLRKIKQLVSGIDTGQSIASIISYFSIPLVILLLPSLQYLLTIATVALIGFTLQLFYIQKTFDYKDLESDSKLNRTRVRQERQEHGGYIFILSCFIIISVFTATFVEYLFLTTLNTQFSNQRELTNFLSFFGGLVVVFSFLIQVFLNDLILERLGLQKSLLIVPALIFIIMFLSILSEIIFPQSTQLVFFVFIMLSVNHLFVTSLRDALEFPTVKYYFFVLPTSIRFTEQNRVDGIVRLIGLSLAGLLITTTDQVYRIKVVIVEEYYVLIILTVLWYFINNRLFSKYQKTLQTALKSSFISSDHSNYLIETYNRFSQIFKSKVYFTQFFQSFSPTTCIDSDREILKLAKVKSIQKDLYHKDVSKRLEALQFIKRNPTPQHLEYLKRFFFDPHPRVKRLAFRTAAELNYTDALPILGEYLDKPFYANAIFEAFVSFSDLALFYLERLFMTKSSQATLKKLVAIMGLIGTAKAIEWLKQKIHYINKEINHEIIRQLALMNQTLADDQKVWIKNQINEQIIDLVRLIYLLDHLKYSSKLDDLYRAIKPTIRMNHEYIFNMLSIIYDPSSIKLIKINYFSGTPDNISYALELLDLTIEDDIKSLVLPALAHYTSSQKRIKKLQAKYGINLLNLNEDYNFWRLLFNINSREGHWIIILGLEYYLTCHPKPPISESALALIQHPMYYIAETATWVCTKIDPVATEKITASLSQRRSKLIHHALNLKYQFSDLPFLKREQVKWLQRSPLFANIEAFVLLLIADESELIKWDTENVAIDNETFQEYIYILVKGKLLIDNNLIINPYQLITTLETDALSISARAIQTSWVYRIEKSHVYILFKYYPKALHQFLYNLKSYSNEEREA